MIKQFGQNSNSYQTITNDPSDKNIPSQQLAQHPLFSPLFLFDSLNLLFMSMISILLAPGPPYP